MDPKKREFLELFERAKRERGWKAVDAARELGFTRGGMHGLLKGDTVPSEVTLRLFRLLMASEAGPEGGTLADARGSEVMAEKPPPYKANVRELVAELDEFDPKQREQMIKALRELVKAARPDKKGR